MSWRDEACELAWAAAALPALGIMNASAVVTQAAARVRLRLNRALDDWAFERMLTPDGPTRSQSAGLSFYGNDSGELGLRVTVEDQRGNELDGVVFISREMWAAFEARAPWANEDQAADPGGNS